MGYPAAAQIMESIRPLSSPGFLDEEVVAGWICVYSLTAIDKHGHESGASEALSAFKNGKFTITVEAKRRLETGPDVYSR